MQIVFTEKELEDFLCQDKNLKKYLGLTFVARQVKIEPIGIVDILAFDWDSKSWVIIELKKDLLDASALCQGLSYLNYYKSTSNYKNYVMTLGCDHNFRKFKLLLIGQNLEQSLHKNIRYFDKCFCDDWDIYYTLFDVKFDSGISFSFLNENQENTEDQLKDIFVLKELTIRNNFCKYFGHLNERNKEKCKKDL